MENFKIEKITDGNHGEEVLVRFTESGYETALIVTRNLSWVDDTEIHEHLGVVDNKEIASAFSVCNIGLDKSYSECEWPIKQSYYWLVKRENGRLYPWPLLFVNQEEREKSTSQHNDWQWQKFYKGHCSSPDLVDCPSEKEINKLLNQIKAHVTPSDSTWDDMDARGGLVPRWAV